ncbi:MAG: tetratricopeptide repeat protein [Bryobacteraceae bacterium]
MRSVVIAPVLLGIGLLASVLAYSGFAHEVPLSPGFEAFFNNDYDGALAFFEREVKAHPDDPDQHNHLAQTILYRELFRNGSLESQLVTGNNAFLRRPKVEISAENRQFFADCINTSLRLCDERLRTNARDRKALYQSGVAHALRSTYSFLVEKQWTDALREAAGARRAQERVLQLDPSFIDARLTLGVYQYVVASLPFYVRAVGFLNGFHGDRAGGLQELESVAREGVSNRYDAKIVLAILYRREHEPAKAIPLLQELAQRFPGNYLFLFEQVQMYSDLGDKGAALHVLERINALQRSNAPGYGTLPPEKIAYIAGNLYFWYRDYDLALARLKEASAHTDVVDLNSAVLTWLRLGQVYDLRGDRPEATSAYRQVIRTGPNSDVAAEAKRYLSAPYRRQAK